MIDFLWRPRPLWVLLTVGAAIGVFYTLTVLPADVVLGRGAYWQFPVGTIPGGINDVATVLVGYSYLMFSPWGLPLLHVPHLVPPAGTNVFWLDSVPWVGLLGKTIFSVTGVAINFLGIYFFLCFVLPGVAMATLLWNAGHKSLIAAVAGAVLTDTAPFLTFAWGHPAQCSQFLLILALSLYLMSLRRLPPHGSGAARVAGLWFGLLALAALTSIYLFVMVGGIWAASVAQRWWAQRGTAGHLAREAVILVGGIVGLMLITGILSGELQSAGSFGFGVASINLASPFIPQRSGLIAPLADYFVGMRSQVFAYLGLGSLLLLLLGLPVVLRWLWQNRRTHGAVLAVLGVYYLFALSHRIFLGSHLVVEIPLPDAVVRALGAFRGSGRFFWPVGYALIAGGIIATCTRFSPPVGVGILAVVSIVQLIDVGPMRRAMAASARQPVPAVLDRAQIATVVAGAPRVVVLPSAACLAEDPLNPADTQLRWQATMEIQLAAARLNLPINSTYTARQLSDCAAEAASLNAPLAPGVAYFYVQNFMPAPSQVGGRKPVDVCFPLGWMHYCLVPAAAGAR